MLVVMRCWGVYFTRGVVWRGFFVVVLCMRNGGGGAGSMSSGAFSTLTSWRFFLRTSPPSVSCTLLPMLLSLHIL